MMRDGVPGPTRADRLAILQSIVSATLSVLPPFLVGALTVSLRAEFGFGPEALGAAVAWFFLTTAVSAPRLGRIVERLGVRASLVVGAAGSALSLLGVSMAPGYLLLLAALTIGGAANAILQPAVNASLSHRIPGGNLGLAIGIKQASIPAATLLGGLAVPTLGVAIGWRWTFAVAALLSATNGVIAWHAQEDQPATSRRFRPRRGKVDTVPHRRSLLILTAGGFLAAAAATTLGAFLVDGGVAIGISEANAGLLFAGSSAFGLVSRVLIGWMADRNPTRSRYGAIIVLLLIGTPGFLLLSTSASLPYVLGAFLAYGAGWGWPGLFHFTVVSQYPSMPAAATGVIQSGVAAGAGLGPLAFGLVAGAASYEAAWAGASGLCLIAAGFFLAGRAHLRRSLRDTVRSVASPRLPSRSDLDAAATRPLAAGVSSSTLRSDVGQVTIIRLEPERSWTARASHAEYVVLTVLKGDRIDLQIGNVPLSARPGAAFQLPTSLLWTASNRGTDIAILAILPRGTT